MPIERKTNAGLDIRLTSIGLHDDTMVHFLKKYGNAPFAFDSTPNFSEGKHVECSSIYSLKECLMFLILSLRFAIN
jgi:hypothetical protein